MDSNYLYRKIMEFKQILSPRTFFVIIKRIMHQPSYYPDMKRKSTSRRLLDNIFWAIMNHEPNRFYNSWGLDIADWRDKKDFIPYRKFAIQRDNKNLIIKNNYNYICILRDKILFSAFIAQFHKGKYVVPVLGKLENGEVHLVSGEKMGLNEYFGKRKGKVFIKKLNGECGDGVYLIEYNGGN